MGFFFDRHKETIPRNATFSLTESGRAKLQEFSGDPTSLILVTLETRGTCNADELSSGGRLSRGKIDRMLPSLLRAGYISLASATDIMD